MKCMLIVMLLLSALGVSQKALADQKIVFCVDTYKYGWKTGKASCGPKCDVDCGLKYLLQDQWKIDATTPKEIIEENWWGFNSNEEHGCTCVGTQYVLSKVEKIDVAPRNDSNTALLEKEIELLKKENELLKKENEMQKEENRACKAKSKKNKTATE
jgi:hypothetical protein